MEKSRCFLYKELGIIGFIQCKMVKKLRKREERKISGMTTKETGYHITYEYSSKCPYTNYWPTDHAACLNFSICFCIQGAAAMTQHCSPTVLPSSFNKAWNKHLSSGQAAGWLSGLQRDRNIAVVQQASTAHLDTGTSTAQQKREWTEGSNQNSF